MGSENQNIKLELSRLDDDIMKIVQEKLPGIQAKALAEHVRLGEAAMIERDELKKRCLDLDGMLLKCRQELSDALDLNRKLTTKDIAVCEKEQKLRDREIGVTRREFRQELLEKDVRCANDKADLVVDMFKTVFKNAEVKRTVTRNVSRSTTNDGGHTDNNGIWQYPKPDGGYFDNEDTKTTTSEEG